MANKDEIRQRVCRACNETYAYPLPKSPATRFHCEACAALPLPVRAVFDKYNKRLKALTAKLDKLQHQCQTATDPRQGPAA